MGEISIDSPRLWSDLMTIGAIGTTARGGSSRPTLSDADRDARNLFVYWSQDAGMTVVVDRIGNIFARREGTDPSLPPVVVGSHLDTQTPGGKFDGVLGVLAGLEVVRSLNRAAISTRRAIEIVDWTNEEGVRFPGLMGSAVFAGQVELEYALAYRDHSGLTVAGELARIGYKGSHDVGGRELDSYLELHIEQGRELEKAGATIGAVTNSYSWAAGTIEVLGENGHSQTEPMSQRRSALVGAARLVLEIESIGAAQEPFGIVSATTIDNWPNNRFNIPHRTVLRYTIVNQTDAGRHDALRQIAAIAETVAADARLVVNNSVAGQRDRLEFSQELIALTRIVGEAHGHKVIDLSTPAGHDALNMCQVCPTAIVFVPNRNGISHSELEWCEPRHACAGANVLLGITLARANRV